MLESAKPFRPLWMEIVSLPRAIASSQYYQTKGYKARQATTHHPLLPANIVFELGQVWVRVSQVTHKNREALRVRQLSCSYRVIGPQCQIVSNQLKVADT